MGNLKMDQNHVISTALETIPYNIIFFFYFCIFANQVSIGRGNALQLLRNNTLLQHIG
jgi:hypothetical protein